MDHVLTSDQLFEELANIEHQKWCDWVHNLLDWGIANDDGSLTILSPTVERWRIASNTPFEELTAAEQAGIRTQVGRSWPIIERHLHTPVDLGELQPLIVLEDFEDGDHDEQIWDCTSPSCDYSVSVSPPQPSMDPCPVCGGAMAPWD